MLRIGGGFIDAFHIAAVENDARRTCENKPADAPAPTSIKDSLRTNNIGFVESRIPAQNAGLGGEMENQVAPLRRGHDRLPVSQVAPTDLHAPGAKVRIFSTRKTAYGVAALQQTFDNSPAQKPASSRNERSHGNCLAAQSASFSRKILALCRMSTGNAG